MSGAREKILHLSRIFAAEADAEGRYKTIIELGKTLKPYPASLKIPSLIVPGCQSILYLAPRLEHGLLFFTAWSEALISAGLAALLIEVYSGESPETILTVPPSFLKELGILGSLTPSRSNGLANIHLRMKQDAVRCLAAGAKP